MTTHPYRAFVALFLLLSLVVIGAPIGAQSDVDLERDVLPAVVQIAVRVVEKGGGLPKSDELVPRGSGTIVSPTGLILTNAHVLALDDVKTFAGARANAYREGGIDRTVEVEEGKYVILIRLGDEPPVPLYTAVQATADGELDLAVLRITGGSRGGPIDALNLKYLPLGDSDKTRVDADIWVVGYPGIVETANVDRGTVNTFEPEVGVEGRAWIVTDATASGGSSGGAAVDRTGHLIGVTTLTETECRPGDTNNDGVTNELDVGCVPVGSSVAKLRPINLAKPLLLAVSDFFATPTATEPSDETIPPTNTTQVPTDTLLPVPPTSTPTPTSVPRPIETPRPTPPTSSLMESLPDELPLDDAGCFQVDREGEYTFEAVVERLSTMPNPAQQLRSWGWSDGAYRFFACDDPPPGGADWIETHIHAFADPDSAQEAVNYFAEARARAVNLTEAASPDVGDHAVALSGRVNRSGDVVNDYTIYASQGPLLVRVNGQSTSRIPSSDILAVAEDLVSTVALEQALPGCGVEGMAYASPFYGYQVTWDPEWRVDACSSGGRYDVLVLTNGISDLVFEGMQSSAVDTGSCVLSQYDMIAARSDISALTSPEERTQQVGPWNGTTIGYSYRRNHPPDEPQFLEATKWCGLIRSNASLVVTHTSPAGRMQDQGPRVAAILDSVRAGTND